MGALKLDIEADSSVNIQSTVRYDLRRVSVAHFNCSLIAKGICWSDLYNHCMTCHGNDSFMINMRDSETQVSVHKLTSHTLYAVLRHLAVVEPKVPQKHYGENPYIPLYSLPPT